MIKIGKDVLCNGIEHIIPVTTTGMELKSFFSVSNDEDLWFKDTPNDRIIEDSTLVGLLSPKPEFYTAKKQIK